jgi:hypothetical protein
MGMTPNALFQWRLLPLLLLLILVTACGSKSEVAGNYQAEGKDLSGEAATALELKSNGDGAWKSGGEEIPFSWHIKGGDLRINTKGGGVIVGDIEKDTIYLTLPGSKPMTFRKIR